MSKRIEIHRLLDRSSEIEIKVAQIYDLLSTRFEHDPTLAHFWSLFAEAERYHSLLIQMQKMMAEQLNVGREPLQQWEAEIDEAILYLDEVLERLVSGWEPTISEAFTLAHDIEGRSLEIQARSFEFADQSAVEDLFSRLHEEDLGHRHKLLQARHKFDPSFENDRPAS